METRIITDAVVIQKLTGKDFIIKILLHLNHKKKSVKYEDDFTGYEITTKLNYNNTMMILNEN